MAMASHRKLRIIDPQDVAGMFPTMLEKGKEEGEQHFRALRRMLWRAEPDLI